MAVWEPEYSSAVASNVQERVTTAVCGVRGELASAALQLQATLLPLQITRRPLLLQFSLPKSSLHAPSSSAQAAPALQEPPAHSLGWHRWTSHQQKSPS